MQQRPIQFYYRGDIVRVQQQPPTRTVLQYLREDLHACGTKEGCAEGDCGACTVAVGELRHGELVWHAVNACLMLLPALDGKALLTVEDLAALAPDGLHPVQQALIEQHGSQCGFCTPGFVMSLFALASQHPGAGRAEVIDALSGNLCRCTGYRPIVDAGVAACAAPPCLPNPEPIVAALQAMATAPALDYRAGGARLRSPRTLAELAELYAAVPEARLLAGGTDLGLWVTKQLHELPELIALAHVDELKTIEHDPEWLRIGAAVTLTDAFAALLAEYPELAELARRFASPPIRNAATLAGNIANGSPIGDSMPALIALGARLRLHRLGAERELALEQFYLGYQHNALAPGEFVRAVLVPRRLPSNAAGPAPFIRAYKASKRYEQDIATVFLALAITRDDSGVVQDARLALGGMAAVPARAPQAEAALIGRPWNAVAVEAAMNELQQDFSPLSDLRGRADHRQRLARRLLWRAWLDSQGMTPLQLDELEPIARPAPEETL
ncbi:xanthine dehydrogenase small subunit [Pseudogulbenkiania subflava]|uniref:Xanthine dehydrogenase small subunit n=1 Tax=Pseudogulbenkiania subflava DSM 22618 TaxID=1123014 RepID=A0A1Y6B4Y8_9NEIS|nr:xanthine dehydrogenase small subunit [Pseudogulbenkiania subflava]SME92361.1 xanthine dehydrogenase small subunit [Pseudogulbenkiania subflava DSM 22618]